MWKILLFVISLAYTFNLHAQTETRTGTIKVRKTKSIKGLYVLEEGDYYQVKCYVRLFDNNAAVFLNAALNAQKANDSTARLLYTYRKNPSVYRVVNDSLYIRGTENQQPVEYRGIVRDNRLRLRKYYLSSEKALVFKKLL